MILEFINYDLIIRGENIMITKEEVIKRCETIFDAIGVNISDEELMETLDSLQYISALVELESEFENHKIMSDYCSP